MDAFNDPLVETVVFIKSAQVGATEMLLNVLGYYIDQDPAAVLLLQPTLEMGEAFSKDRLAPMIRDSPCLSGAVMDAKSRDSGNTLLHKKFTGGHVTIAGSNSPASLASRPIRIVLADEVDRYPASAGAEGDPVNLARKRTTTFWNRKIGLFSTPTLKGTSRIEAAWEESDQRRYFVPCPKCGEFQVLWWRNLKWDEGKPETARYVCDVCACELSHREKARMLRRGEWRATADGRPGVAGFHINELYSPWVEWGTMAANFLEAKKRPETLKTFINTSLGETWEEEGDGADDAALFARREHYPAEVPAGAAVLTAGVDVQDDRLEVHVWGWGRDFESWAICSEVFFGDPAREELWAQVDQVLSRTFEHASGHGLRIHAACVDTGGHHTKRAYDFCKKRFTRHVYAIKGQAGGGKPLAGRPSRANSARVRLFPVGVDTAKELLYGRLRILNPGPGYVHFPVTLDEEWFQQLTAERVQTKFVKGFPRREWVKTRPRNEALDGAVYALAALEIAKPNLDRLLKDLEQAAPVRPAPRPVVETKDEEPTAGQEPEEEIRIEVDRPKKAKRPAGGFVGGFRGRAGFATNW